jgi:hypothetical protein
MYGFVIIELLSRYEEQKFLPHVTRSTGIQAITVSRFGKLFLARYSEQEFLNVSEKVLAIPHTVYS